MSAGWVPCETGWWEAVAAALEASGQPWPEEAVLMDLRWWDDRERMSGGRRPRPGRPTLQRRWGLTERPARRLMAAFEEWQDPARGELRGVKPTSSDRQAGAQQTSSDRQATVKPTSSDRQADVQDSSAKGRHTKEHRQADVQQTSSDRQADVQQTSSGRQADAKPVPPERPQREITQPQTQPPSHPHTHPAAEAPGGARGSVCGETSPGWLRAAAAAGKVEPQALGLALVAAAAAVTGRPSAPEWGGLPGRGTPLTLHEVTLAPALRLWQALERPSLDGWLAEVRAVARAAREHRDPTFARWIRGEGTTFGNRSDRLKTVLEPERWPERAELACAAPSAPAPLRLVEAEPEPAGDAGLDSMVQLLSEQVGTAATAELLAAATAAHLSQADIMGLLIKICTGRRQSEAVELEIDRLRSSARAAR